MKVDEQATDGLVSHQEKVLAGDAPAGDGDARQAHWGTVEFLLRRMQHSHDFPVLSESIRTLNQLADSGDQDVSRLASVIIRDFALTSKILKVVNSAYYSRFSGKIGSVSRAIVVLGIDTIRSLATSLIFFEHLQDRDQASRLKDEISGAIFAATLSRHVAADAGITEDEEAFLCGMLHNLGRLLVTYYLPEESAEIDRLTGQEGMAQVPAEKQVLGMTLEQMGVAVAQAWNFPPEVTRGMVRLDPAAPGSLQNPGLKLRLIAGFANETAQLIGGGTDDIEALQQQLLKRYRMGLAISDPAFKRILSETRREFLELSGSLVSQRRQGDFLNNLLRRSDENETSPITTSLPPDIGDSLILDPEPALAAAPVPADMQGAQPSPDAERILTEGLQEVSGLLAEEGNDLNQILNVTLETIYRAMAFQRVVICLQEVAKQRYTARLGFGDDIDAFMSGFRFPARYSANVFHAALKNGVDLYIADAGLPKVSDSLPGWYKQICNAGSFLLFPLLIRGHSLGLIYADHPKANGMDLSEGQLNLLKALRNQVVLGFRTRG